MTHDDDFADLDRLLAPLALEEPPAGLRSRILAGTIYRPRSVVRTWELWALGTLIALAVWLCWTIISAPHAGERVVDAAAQLIDADGLSSLGTVLWLAVGVSATWWVSQISVPSRRRVRSR